MMMINRHMTNNNENDIPFELSILDLQKQEKEKEQKRKRNERMKKYLVQPNVKIQKLNEQTTNGFKNFGISDSHEICKKLGHTRAWSRRNPDYFYRCSKCDVSYSDKEKSHFFKENHCPCCHLMLRTRKTITKKRSENI